MIHTWRIRTRLIVQKHRADDPAVGEPQQRFESRLPVQAKKYDGIPVAVRKPPGEVAMMRLSDTRPAIPDISREVVELVADVQVPATDKSFTEAIERYAPVFGCIIDFLTFDMAAALDIDRVEMVDITPPVSVGDERDVHRFTSPPFDRYLRSVEMLSMSGRLHGALPEPNVVEALDSKTSAALRWYAKALATDVLHDQFIFLWIALEILCGMTPSARVDKTYKAPCGHDIPECPQCGKSTAKKVEGSTKKEYLKSYEVSAEQAEDLWQMRQMMHGAINFDSNKVQGLNKLVPPLRAVVAAGLKKQLGRDPSDVPIVRLQAGYIMHPGVGAGGRRPVIADDVSPLIT